MSLMSISDLPRGCLVHILEFVPLKERLQTSTLVSVAWSQAAAAATTSISKQSGIASTAECLAAESWATCHAHHLSSLDLTTVHNSAPACFLQPWLLPALQHLTLRGVHLQLGSSSDSHNSLTRITLLTSLHLSDCSVLPDIRALAALSALQRLQRLALNLNIRPLQQRSAPAPEWALPGASTWSHLTALTLLDLKYQHNVTDTVLRDLAASLTQLQQLDLYAGELSVAGLAHLQPLQLLSALTLSVGPHLPFTCSTTPVLGLLQGLRCLSLFCWKQLEPALLASLSGLQGLSLKGWSKRQSPEDLPALLGALACMTCLTTLDLQVCWVVLVLPFDVQNDRVLPHPQALVFVLCCMLPLCVLSRFIAMRMSPECLLCMLMSLCLLCMLMPLCLLCMLMPLCLLCMLMPLCLLCMLMPLCLLCMLMSLQNMLLQAKHSSKCASVVDCMML
jgi:hypothetical protein